jgi:hypothetical protein
LKLAPGALDRIEYTEATLQRLQFYARTLLTEEVLRNTKVESYVDQRLRGLVIEMQAAIYGRKLGTDQYRWPATWWDAVKERFAPHWFLKRYPVQHRGVDVTAYHTYPTIKVHNNKPYLHFMHEVYDQPHSPEPTA